MSGFDEDRADSQVNTTILEQEFDLDTTEDRQAEIDAIADMRNQLMVAGQADDPDTIILSNIERANNLLDTAQHAINNGGHTNARLFEVCAQLINAVTSAATSVQNTSFGIMKHEYNMEMIEVKKQEVAVKAILANDKTNKPSGGIPANGNVVVMTREALLNMIDDDEREVEVQSHGTPEEN
jgi:hypothetical protein